MNLRPLLLMVLCAAAALGNESYRGWCELGGKSVTTAGMASVTKTQASYPLCTLTIYPHGSTTPVASNQVFSDNSGTVLGNPFTADSSGYFTFFVANGHYDIKRSGTIPTWTEYDVLFADPSGSSPAVTSVSAGAGIAVTGPATTPTVSNTGVTSVSAGAGISVTGPAGTPAIANTGVTSATAGAGMSVSGASGGVTFTNLWGIPPSGSQLSYLRIQPNTGNNVTYQFSGIPPLVSTDYNFPAQTPGGSLIIGSNTISMSPCPVGVNGTDIGHSLKIFGGVGSTEGAMITGGNCVSGAASGTVIVKCIGTHTGAWQVASDAGGIEEAISALGPTVGYQGGAGISTGGGSVYIPPSTYTLYGGPILVPSNVEVYGVGPASLVVPASTGQTIFQLNFSINARLHDVACEANQTGTVCYDLLSAQFNNLWNLSVIGGNGVTGSALTMRATATGSSADLCFGNVLHDLDFEIAPTMPIVLTGFGTTGNGIVTENHFYDVKVAGGDAVHPMIDIRNNADTNFWDRITCSSSIATICIGVGIGDGTTDEQVGGQVFQNIEAATGGANSATLVIGPTNHIHAVNITSWFTSPFTVNALATDIDIRNANDLGGIVNDYSSSGKTFGTASLPTAIHTPMVTVTLVNGANQDVNAKKSSAAFISGPTAAFSIGGIIPTGFDGQLMTVCNTTAYSMTLTNEAAGSTAAYRISTGTGADLIMPASSSGQCARVIYSAVNTRWRLVSPVASLGAAVYSGGALKPNSIFHHGTCTLGTNCAVALSPAYTGVGTYDCSGTDKTTAAAAKVVNTSASVVTFTGTGTDVISYVCVGN